MRAAFVGWFALQCLPAFSVEAKYITLNAFDLSKVHPGETITLSVRFKVDPGMHVQANPASAKNLIATAVSFDPVKGLEIGQPSYPTSKSFRLRGSETDIATYDGNVEIKVPLTASPKAKLGKHKLKGKLRYQACEATSCFFPMSVALEAPVLVLAQ